MPGEQREPTQHERDELISALSEPEVYLSYFVAKLGAEAVLARGFRLDDNWEQRNE